MSLFRRFSALVASVACSISVNAYSIAPLPGDHVGNGGFESGLSGGWSFNPFVTGSVTPTNAFSGMGSASFHTTSPSEASIVQNITTTPSTTYIATFHLKATNTIAPNNFNFKLNSGALFTVTDDIPHDYQLHTYVFTTPARGRTATSNTISFNSNVNTGYFYLDDVSIIPIPVPCNNNFYSFDYANGRIKIESGKTYPNPPQPDSSFPFIANGQLIFNYKSDPVTHTFPRRIAMALAPPGLAVTFAGTALICQFEVSGGTGCPALGDMALTFVDFETLFIKHCVARSVDSGSSLITYSADVFTLYLDPQFFDDAYSELTPFPMTMTVPYLEQAMTSRPPTDVVTDEVSVSYLPVEVIYDGSGSNPVVQFTTIATTFYPFVANGDGTTYAAPPSGLPTLATDPSGTGDCVLYQSTGIVAPDSAYCDSHPGICTVECTRIIPVVAPVCDLGGYDWTFAFKQFQDFSLATPATTQSTDPTWASFTEELLFDYSPQWNVCSSAASPDYSSVVNSYAIHGHFDRTTGNPVPDNAAHVLATVPLNFGFEIYINTRANSNGVSATTSHIYKAILTEVKVTGPRGDYYLVGSSSSPSIGGTGADVSYVHGLTFDPPPRLPGVYQMSISPQTNPTDPKFATISVSFIPNLGDPSGSNILYTSDSGSFSSLSAEFAGVISLSTEGSTPTNHEITFRRQISTSINGTYADPSQVAHSILRQNSTTIVVDIPKVDKVDNHAGIAGAIIGRLFLLCFLFVAAVAYRRRKLQGQKVDARYTVFTSKG